jgi:hypothetical protein
MKSRYKPGVINARPLSLFKHPLTTRYLKVCCIKENIDEINRIKE